MRGKIEDAFEVDIKFFYWLVNLIETIKPNIRKLNLKQIVETFAQTVKIEMDLRLEAAAAAELKENFSDHDYFYVPEIDWERTSKRVLTLERINGIKINSRKALLKANIDSIMLVLRKTSSDDSVIGPQNILQKILLLSALEDHLLKSLNQLNIDCQCYHLQMQWITKN